MSNSQINAQSFTQCLMFIFDLSSEKIERIFGNQHLPSKFRECLNGSKTHEHGCIKFYLSLTEHNRDKLIKSATELSPESEIEIHIKNLVLAMDFNSMLKYLTCLPDDTQFDYKIGFTSYSFVKLSNSKFEIHCTSDSWVTAQEQTELVCLFLLGKLDSLCFAWN